MNDVGVSNEKAPALPSPPRISWGFIGEQLLQHCNFERGLGFTLQQLLIRPGPTVNRYLFQDRSRLVKPLTFLVLALTLYVVATNILRIPAVPPEYTEILNDEEVSAEARRALERSFEFLHAYLKLLLALLIPLAAAITYWFQPAPRWFYTEHLVVNTYLHATQTILFSLTLPLGHVDFNLTFYVGIVISLLFSTYFLKAVFGFSWLKSLATAVLVLFTTSAFSALAGMLIVLWYAVTG